VGAIDVEIGNSRFRLVLGTFARGMAYGTALSIWLTEPTRADFDDVESKKARGPGTARRFYGAAAARVWHHRCCV